MTDREDSNKPSVIWHAAAVSREQREKLNGHRGRVLWFTGLPSSGKSTIAHALEEKLYRMSCCTFVMDGDNLRHGLCSDLGFSMASRTENIRRIGEVARLFVEAGVIVLTAFVSPVRSDRARARGLFQPGDFLEVYCRCSADVCEERDPKGLYKRARAGDIKDFTGVSSPYEAPYDPELLLDTATLTVEASVELVYGMVLERGVMTQHV
jgi:adenylylsulfate kinase